MGGIIKIKCLSANNVESTIDPPKYTRRDSSFNMSPQQPQHNEKQLPNDNNKSKPQPPEKEPTEISDLIGHWGKYQLQIFIFKVIIGMTSPFNNLGVTFAAPEKYINYQCIDYTQTSSVTDTSTDDNTIIKNDSSYIGHDSTDNDKTSIKHQCQWSNGTQCTSWKYDIGSWHSTMIDEWNLVCDRAWLVSFSQSVYMFSFILAFLLFGPLSDRYGRFKSLLLGAILEIIAGLGCALSTSVTMFIIFRFFVGFGCAGRSSSAYLTVMEWVGRKYRMQISCLTSLGWTLGYCIMPWIVCCFMHFRHFQLAVCAYEFVLLVWLLTLPESPRFLLTHGKAKEAYSVLFKAAKINNVKLEGFDERFREYEAEISGKNYAINEHKMTIIDLFRWPNLRMFTIILFFTWACNSFIYYGIALHIGDFGTDLFLDFSIAGLTELPAMFFTIACMKLMPRKTTNLVIFIVTGIFLALMFPLKYYKINFALTSLAMMNKLLISIASISVQYQTIEIYPTTVRQTASSACQLSGRIGSTLAPFIKEFASITHELIPPLIYAGLALICAALGIVLPETKSIDLPDTMEEAENVKSRRKQQIQAKKQRRQYKQRQQRIPNQTNQQSHDLAKIVVTFQSSNDSGANA